MFVTKELNAITQLFQDGEVSQAVQEQLYLEYVNLEATLLRGKVLRDFSKEKLTYIVQAKIEENDHHLGYLFAPFIIANLNQPVIYTTPISTAVLAILNQYYQAEKSVNLKIEEVLQSLKLYVDLVEQPKKEEDFVFRAMIKALCRTDISHLFLIRQPLRKALRWCLFYKPQLRQAYTWSVTTRHNTTDGRFPLLLRNILHRIYSRIPKSSVCQVLH